MNFREGSGRESAVDDNRCRKRYGIVAEIRDGLRALLSSVPDAELVGEAATGEEAVALATSIQPDVVLMDLQMPDLNGIEATRTVTGMTTRSTFARIL